MLTHLGSNRYEFLMQLLIIKDLVAVDSHRMKVYPKKISVELDFVVFSTERKQYL